MTGNIQIIFKHNHIVRYKHNWDIKAQVETKMSKGNQNTFTALAMNYLIKTKRGGPPRESCKQIYKEKDVLEISTKNTSKNRKQRHNWTD